MLIPWDRMRRWSIDGGVFKVWVQGSEDPAVSENVAEPNFFPGLFVFESIKG